MSLWFSKHRPDTWDRFVGQPILREELSNLTKNNMQHYLFHSPEAGTGKTTAAHLLANELGFQLHIFNASSKRQRGIEFVEEDLIPLSQSGRWETIILLDEADRLTIQAQDALKGVIENATCYFILTCNDLGKVSRWLQSRCQVRTFAPIRFGDMYNALHTIATEELLTISPEHLTSIAKRHEGDLRNAISCLQSYSVHPEKEKYISILGDSSFNSKSFLKTACKAKAVESAHKMIESMPLRQTIKTVLDYAVESSVSTEAKMKVIDASITSERDILMGVDEAIVSWNYCRLLASVG